MVLNLGCIGGAYKGYALIEKYAVNMPHDAKVSVYSSLCLLALLLAIDTIKKAFEIYEK